MLHPSLRWSYLQKRSRLDHMTGCLLVNILSGIFWSTTAFFYCSSQYCCKLNAEHLNRIVKTARLNPISKTRSSSFTRYRFTSWKCYFWSGKEKNDFLSRACVWKWQRGVRVHTTLFSGLPSRGDWWWEMSIREETCRMVEWKHASLCGYRPLKSSVTLTSLGRGSLECGWTSALGCNSVGGYWLSNDSSIFPPGWWVLLKKDKHRLVSGSLHIVFYRLRLAFNSNEISRKYQNDTNPHTSTIV